MASKNVGTSPEVPEVSKVRLARHGHLGPAGISACNVQILTVGSSNTPSVGVRRFEPGAKMDERALAATMARLFMALEDEDGGDRCDVVVPALLARFIRTHILRIRGTKYICHRVCAARSQSINVQRTMQ